MKKPTYTVDEMVELIPILDSVKEIDNAAHIIAEERERYRLADFRLLLFMLAQRLRTLKLKGGAL